MKLLAMILMKKKTFIHSQSSPVQFGPVRNVRHKSELLRSENTRHSIWFVDKEEVEIDSSHISSDFFTNLDSTRLQRQGGPDYINYDSFNFKSLPSLINDKPEWNMVVCLIERFLHASIWSQPVGQPASIGSFSSPSLLCYKI